MRSLRTAHRMCTNRDKDKWALIKTDRVIQGVNDGNDVLHKSLQSVSNDHVIILWRSDEINSSMLTHHLPTLSDPNDSTHPDL